MLEGGRLQARRSPTLDRNYNASRGHNDSNGRAPPGGPPPLARRRPAPAPAPALPRARLQHVGLMLVILSITVLYYGIHMYTLYVCISLSLYIYIYIYIYIHTSYAYRHMLSVVSLRDASIVQSHFGTAQPGHECGRLRVRASAAPRW